MTRLLNASVIAAASLLLAASLPATAAPRQFSCPARYVSGDQLPQGWWSAKRTEPNRLKNKNGAGALDGLWLVEGKRGEEIAEAPAILAPEKGGWDLADSGYGFMLVCLYRGSEDVLATALPTDIKRCSLKPQKDGSALFRNGTLSCQ